METKSEKAAAYVQTFMVNKVKKSFESEAGKDELVERKTVTLKRTEGGVSVTLSGDSVSLDMFGLDDDRDAIVRFRPGDDVRLELYPVQSTLMM